jgi:16S rRNA (cytosine1402-N4)-methyltransferase
VYVDGTFGAGGYSRAILSAAACTVIALDQDPTTHAFAEKLAAEFGERFVFIAGNFGDMCELLAARGVERVDGVVLDLGVSSMQLDESGRGFSFRHDGPLDMRMGAHGTTAAELVNNAAELELADILYRYGEERMSRRIAKFIVQARAEAPITRTSELAAVVARAVGRTGDKDPATRTFQGIRIHLNDELGALERGLEAAETLLKPGWRLVVITFHSLEDRIVKRFTHSRSGKLEGASRHRPHAAGGGGLPSFSLCRPEKIRVSDEEARANPRARSATLRAARRLPEAA